MIQATPDQDQLTCLKPWGNVKLNPHKYNKM